MMMLSEFVDAPGKEGVSTRFASVPQFLELHIDVMKPTLYYVDPKSALHTCFLYVNSWVHNN